MSESGGSVKEPWLVQVCRRLAAGLERLTIRCERWADQINAYVDRNSQSGPP